MYVSDYFYLFLCLFSFKYNQLYYDPNFIVRVLDIMSIMYIKQLIHF